MSDTVASVGTVVAAIAVHLAAGIGLGLLAGFFGRTVLGLAAAIILVTALTGSGQTCAEYFARGVSYVPRQEVVAFLYTTGGVSVLAGFIGGLYFTRRGGGV